MGPPSDFRCPTCNSAVAIRPLARRPAVDRRGLGFEALCTLWPDGSRGSLCLQDKGISMGSLTPSFQIRPIFCSHVFSTRSAWGSSMDLPVAALHTDLT